MKKILIFLVSIFLLVGCSTLEIGVTPNVEVTIDGDNVANVTLVPSYGLDWIFTKGTKGYQLNVENTSDSLIRVNWEKSSIFYDSTSSLVFINGQKYANSDTPMPSSIVPVKGKFNTGVYASDQVHYASSIGWVMNNIPCFESTVIICIEHSSGETNYIFNITSQALPEA